MSAVVDQAPYIRNMSARDIDAVLGIERAAYDFPWSAHIFNECLKVGYVCRVCVGEAGMVGYGIMSIGAGECHVMNLCVDPAHHGRGYGSNLLVDLLSIAARRRARTAFLEVRISNHRAHALYQLFGFNEVGTRRNYYPARRGREDAYVLAKTLD